MRKGQGSQLFYNFMIGLIAAAAIGYIFMGLAGDNVPSTVTDYSAATAARLNIAPDLNSSINNMNAVVNSQNSTGFVGAIDQIGLLLGVGQDLVRVLFDIPNFLNRIGVVVLSSFGIDPTLVSLGILTVVVIVILIFFTLIIARGA